MKSAFLRIATILTLVLAPAAILRAKPVVPTPAPAWKLKDVDGNTVTSDQFKGKVVILDFWATWCPPCRTEVPEYVRLQKKYEADGLVIVGVSLDTGGTAPVKKFVKSFSINFPIVMANDDIQSAYGPLEGYPTTFIIDREGRIRDKKLGLEPPAKFEQDLVAILNPPAP